MDIKSEIKNYIDNYKYQKIKYLLKEKYEDYTPFDLFEKFNMKFMQAVFCRYVSNLDDEILIRLEELKFNPEMIIALNCSPKKMLNNVIDIIEKEKFTDPSLINELVFNLKDNLLFSIDKFGIKHVGAKAFQYGQISKNAQNLLINSSSYILQNKVFSSISQKLFFINTMKKIYESDVLKRPCKNGVDTCDHCKRCQEILDIYFGE